MELITVELINHKNAETYAITKRTSSKEDQVLCQVEKVTDIITVSERK
jgi:hypothetical protein